MSLLFIDSFDHYQSAQIPAKWSTVGNPLLPPTIVVGAGRCGTNAIRFNVTPGRSATKGIPFGGAGDVAILGFAIQITEQGLATAMPFLYLLNFDNEQLSLRRSTDGTLSVYREDPAPVLLGQTPPDVTRIGEYYYIEIKATISNAAGAVVVRVNGVTQLTLAGIDTQSSLSATAQVSGFRFQGGANFAYYLDDLYAADAQGAVNNDFLGDSRVEYLSPVAPGANQAWLLVGKPTHWEAVSDGASPDGDTSYIYTTSSGVVDTQEYSNTGLPAGTIFGLQIGLYARKTDAGLRSLAPIVRHAGIDYIGTPQNPSFPSYSYLHQLYETNPGTAAPWVIADVNAAEYGVRVTT